MNKNTSAPRVARVKDKKNARRARKKENASARRGGRMAIAILIGIVGIAAAALLLLMLLGSSAPAHMLPTVTAPGAAASAQQ